MSALPDLSTTPETAPDAAPPTAILPTHPAPAALASPAAASAARPPVAIDAAPTATTAAPSWNLFSVLSFWMTLLPAKSWCDTYWPIADEGLKSPLLTELHAADQKPSRPTTSITISKRPCTYAYRLRSAACTSCRAIGSGDIHRPSAGLRDRLPKY